MNPENKKRTEKTNGPLCPNFLNKKLRFLRGFLVTFTETIYATCTVNEFLFACVEWMTFIADIDMCTLDSSTCFNLVTA